MPPLPSSLSRGPCVDTEPRAASRPWAPAADGDPRPHQAEGSVEVGDHARAERLHGALGRRGGTCVAHSEPGGPRRRGRRDPTGASGHRATVLGTSESEQAVPGTRTSRRFATSPRKRCHPCSSMHCPRHAPGPPRVWPAPHPALGGNHPASGGPRCIAKATWTGCHSNLLRRGTQHALVGACSRRAVRAGGQAAPRSHPPRCSLGPSCQAFASLRPSSALRVLPSNHPALTWPKDALGSRVLSTLPRTPTAPSASPVS